MDISSVSASPSTIPSSSNAGTQGVVQTIPAASGPAPAQTDTSGFTSSNTALPTTASARDTTSPERLTQALKQVNDSFTQKGQNLYAAFEKDKATGINVVKIVDKKTNETISQLPIKEMVAFAQSLEHPQGMRGKLINATA